MSSWVYVYDFDKPLSDTQTVGAERYGLAILLAAILVPECRDHHLPVYLRCQLGRREPLREVTYNLDYQVHWGVRNPGAWLGL